MQDFIHTIVIATARQLRKYILILSVDGLMHKEVDNFSTAPSYKWDQAYFITSGYVRVRLGGGGVCAGQSAYVLRHTPNGGLGLGLGWE